MSDDTFEPTHRTTSDDDLLAVAACVDGVATTDERTRVESSPDLTALAETWLVQRERLVDRSTSTPPAGASAAALAAAMAVYDDIHAAPATPVAAGVDVASVHTPGNVVTFQRRQRRYRLVMGAAAAVAVLFVGAAIVGNGLGGSDDESSVGVADSAAGKMTPTADALTADDQIAAATPFADGGDDETGDGAGDGAGDAMDDATAAEGSAFEASLDTLAPAAAGAVESTEAAPGNASFDPITGPAEVVVTISTPEQLLDFARSRTVQLPLPGFEFTCVPADIEALGVAEYQGVQVVVTRDPATGEIAAVELISCDPVASITP